MRWNLKAEKKDTRITHAVLKTIAAFLNSDGGTLLIGVSDDGEVLGLVNDHFENQDKALLFLTNVIKSQLGELHMEHIHYQMEELENNQVLRVDVQAGTRPCYLVLEKFEHFYIRTGPSTTDLRLSKVYAYINERFTIN